MNWIFPALIVVSVLAAAFTGTMQQVGEASISSAKGAVDLALNLAGQMTLWLGLLGVLREAGLVALFARGLRPVMRRLFPGVPAEHPAMGSMIMNIAANMLGLGNAATPFGLKAMGELNTLNPRPGVATDSMALFLAINTTGIAVLPLSAVAVRAALGSKNPAGIIVPTLLTTFCATLAAVAAARLFQGLPWFSADRYPAAAEATSAAPVVAPAPVAPVSPPGSPAKLAVMIGVGLALAWALERLVVGQLATASGFEVFKLVMSSWVLPGLILSVVALGFGRGVKVYEAFIASAKEGFATAVSVIPFLVGMLVAIGMFRASGAMEVMVGALRVVTGPFGFPAEALPMALIRPLSGSGATAVMSETLKTLGPDSFIGYLVSTINGGTETTFYVLALYFGAVQVRAMRHTLPACLVADVAGPIAALFFCRLFF
jgi:spore maturation protein SpmA